MRLGLMLPSVNTVSEPEFNAGTPADVSVHTARMFARGTSEASVREMIADEVPRAARDVGSTRPDVVVLACTAVGAVLGAEGEARLVGEIEERVAAPVVSMNLSVREVLARTGARRVAVLTPYPDDVTQRVAEGLRADGFEVPVTASMGYPDAFPIAAIDADQLIAFVQDHVSPGDVDALFLSCGNLRVLEARERLEEQYGVPVVASNLATLEMALERLAEVRA